MKSTPCHPGALERFHQTLKTIMQAYCFQESKAWDEGIPLLLENLSRNLLALAPLNLCLDMFHVHGPRKLLKELDYLMILQRVY